MATLTLGTEHRQQQTLSPRLQRAVRLLQLSSLDFAHEVQDILGKNPFLEGDEGDEIDDFVEAGKPGGASLASDERIDAEPIASVETSETEVANAEVDADHENWQSDGTSTRRRNDGIDSGGLELRAAEESLADHLLRQLCVLPLQPRDLALVEAIVGSLDDDGYLRTAAGEIAAIARLSPPPRAKEIQIALSRVQALDPAGIGARSVQECLLLQLSRIECPRRRELAQRIIADHLDALAAKDIAGLARALSCDPQEIDAVVDAIRRFDPHPGWRFGASHAQYVVPDVIVRKARGEWRATLNPAIVPKVRLNRVYAEMFQRQRHSQHAELAAHLQEARWMVSNVEQRFATILSVAQAIVRRQRHFLEYGALAMKPLGLREIADEVGVHESTVSRVTNNKFMATPLGVFELKYFFSRVMTTANGGACSATAIRGLIKDMIAGESPQAPLSDAEIGRLLARQGLVVARRTVTKYRQLLRIESFERRRKRV
jgi:RNA polymerase sigma-54 factor